MHNPPTRRQAGFTMIEVLVSLALVVGTYALS